MEHGRFARPAAAAEGATTEQPERALQAGDPKMEGAGMAEERKGIVGKVKDMMGRRGRRRRTEGAADGAVDGAAEGGILHKIKAKASSKAGHGEDGSKHGPARLLSMSSSGSSLSSSDEEDIGTVGFAMDPTGPAVAGATLGRRDYSNAPEGPGADLRDLTVPSGAAPDPGHDKRTAEYSRASNPVQDDNASHPTPPPPNRAHAPNPVAKHYSAPHPGLVKKTLNEIH